MKYLAFDLELASLQAGVNDITCAATLREKDPEPVLWFSGSAPDYAPRMFTSDCKSLVAYLEDQVSKGYTLLTWNGLGFDFRILAEQSQEEERCGQLAMGQHVDMMFQIACVKGYPVGLAAALAGQGLPGKKGMKGDEAPAMWLSDPEKVLEYVAGDVEGTLAVALRVQEAELFRWTSKSGRPQVMLVNQWLTVKECLTLPEPDVSWMKDPRPRKEYYSWIE